MKPGPIIAMVLIPMLGLWLIWNRPSPVPSAPLRAGAELHHVRIGSTRGVIEVAQEPAGAHTFRIIMSGDDASPVLPASAFTRLFGERLYRELTGGGENALFRLFNITSWLNMAWIAIGLGGQAIFMSRFLIQWVVSERRRESVIPTIFWWISLTGAVFLFAYFVWRRDVVGMLGQSTGVVIYARNLRLIKKQRRRAARQAAQQEGAAGDPTDEPTGAADSGNP